MPDLERVDGQEKGTQGSDSGPVHRSAELKYDRHRHDAEEERELPGGKLALTQQSHTIAQEQVVHRRVGFPLAMLGRSQSGL
jgi:hypothetical protein